MKKILIIDDEPNITHIIELFAGRLGYSTDISHTGDAGVEKVKNSDYWAVFCDFKMPGLNGLEIFDKISELSSNLSRRFVLLTGAIPDKKTEAQLTEKKILLFRKPFNFNEFSNLFSVLEKQPSNS